MSLTFLHTADWQIGKPYGSIENPERRVMLQTERVEAVKRMGALAAKREAAFVLVAGDLFDSTTPSRENVSRVCAAVGNFPCPVFVLPGNHDHSGPGTVWSNDYFRQERDQLAPNLILMDEPRPYPLDGAPAVLLPAPLAARSQHRDPASWLRNLEAATLPEGLRIAVLHGSVIDFAGAAGREDEQAPAPEIQIGQLPPWLDYIALGDWHGTVQLSEKAWYSGAPEADRFPRHENYQTGRTLVVTLEDGVAPVVEPVETGRFQWHRLVFELRGDGDFPLLESAITHLVGNRVDSDLLHLTLSGSLGLANRAALDALLDTLRARFLRLRLRDSSTLAPTDEECAALKNQTANPVLATVAATLIEESQSPDENVAATARTALRQLHRMIHTTENA